jgi:hypothetical protein
MKAPTTDGRITGLLNKGSTGHSLAGLAFSLAVISLLSVAVLAAPAGGEFLLTTNAGTGWLTSLRHAGDTNRVEFLRPGQALGAVTLRVRTPGATWREVRQSTNGVELTSRFHSHKDALLWEISVKNTGRETLEVGDLALPLPMNTDYVWDHAETFDRRVKGSTHSMGCF